MQRSMLGLVSVLLASISAAAILGSIAVAGILESQTPGGLDEDSTVNQILGCSVIIFGFLEFVALVLGIIGLFQKDRSRTMPVIGVVLSALVLLGTGFIMLIGIAVAEQEQQQYQQ